MKRTMKRLMLKIGCLPAEVLSLHISSLFIYIGKLRILLQKGFQPIVCELVLKR